MAKSRTQVTDPLANVRIEDPKSAAVVVEKPRSSTSGMSAKTNTAKADLKAEKLAVVMPPKGAGTAKPAVKFRVTKDKIITWRGQKIRLKAQLSIVGEEKYGMGVIAKFSAMGVEMEEV